MATRAVAARPPRRLGPFGATSRRFVGTWPYLVPALVSLSLAMMEWWWGLGFHTLFYLAGLATIPKDLYESARVDGASEWRIFLQITFPRLRPILLLLVVLRFGTAFALIDEYIILGGFNPDRPTYTWTVYIWDNAFQIRDWNPGFAAAGGW